MAAETDRKKREERKLVTRQPAGCGEEDPERLPFHPPRRGNNGSACLVFSSKVPVSFHMLQVLTDRGYLITSPL